MSEVSRGNGTGILVAALAGAAIGAGVALILARRTRGFKDRAGMVFEQSKDAVSNGVITL